MNWRKKEIDRERREKIKKWEKECKFLKLISRNTELSNSTRLEAEKRLNIIGESIGLTKKRDRCYLTGQNRSVVKKLGLYRTRVNKLIRKGIHPSYVPSKLIIPLIKTNYY